MEKLVSEIERNAVAEEFVNENIKSASSKLSAELMRQKTNPPRPVERKLSGRGQVPQPKIQKVPQVLRDEQKSLEKYYDPMWISIGPIHHGNPKFRLAEQHFKFLFAAKFVKNSGHQSHDYLYRKVMKNIKELKQCFDDEVLDEYYGNGKDDEALGWMLFLDGCFTLQFIYSTVNGESMRHFEIKNDQVAFVFHDFFLLENQIPYLVLSLLMDNSEKEFSKSLQGSIMQFLNFNVLTPEKYRKAVMVPPKDMPVHLLDFLRLALLQQSYHYGNRRSNSCIYTCLLACLPRQLRNKLLSPPSLYKPKRSTKKPTEENQQTFRSVMDLKAAGINLKQNKSGSLKDIKFSSSLFSAELELPPITVDDSMAPKFLNLIAFEMCPDNTKTEYEISSYISLLGSIIYNSNDVKELISANILHNLLGSEDEIAVLFKDTNKMLVPNPEVYETVIQNIEKHYNRHCAVYFLRALNKLWNNYFDSPWALVTFLAATIALVLTGLQTWFTIYSPPGPCDNFCHNLNHK
ncbi:uncharacterized protein LOC133829516 [Humulus lupulus]|uniref:uncharacterized protein LOC133829516 n=1 Tax=Humulus lupulus TaxID=3486 RepID=UPI002B413785|nr:uncharacterized protein LOC133829516 [Humulus lupulus]